MTEAAEPFVAIAVPVLNEAGYIEACLESLLRQVPEDRLEILVMDGGSTDATISLVEAMQVRHPCIRLVREKLRIAAAINRAAELADPRATLLFRADAHALYKPDFVAQCLAAFATTGATSVVVPMRTAGVDGFQVAIAAAQNSRLGNGGSAHRIGGVSRFVDHGHHAAFDRAFFRSIGGYDPAFIVNEDAELDYRAVQAGGRIWMCVEAGVTYFPRKTLGSLLKQYGRHGGGRAHNLLTHRMRPKLRQLAPLFVLAGVVGGLVLAPFHWAFALLPLSDLLLCQGWAVVAAVQAHDARLLGMGVAAMAMHLAWAWGFLRTVVRTALSRR